MTQRLRLSIARLVLEGEAPTDRAGYERALRAALGQHLAEAAAAGTLGARHIWRLDGEGAAQDAPALGQQIVARLRGDGR
jgi:hypothetical protein